MATKSLQRGLVVSFSDFYLFGIIATACFLVKYRDSVLDWIEENVGVKFSWSVDFQYGTFVFFFSCLWLPLVIFFALSLVVGEDE